VIPARDRFGDFLFQRFSDAFDFAQPVFGDNFRLAHAFNRARGIHVGARLERVFAL
jgi:hypothetical protein